MSASLAPQAVPIDWPHRSASRAVQTAGVDWHVQVMGSGPAILLIHGSGAASHSWRDVAPLLAREFTVIIPDLPGHGFTSRPNDDCLTFEALAANLDTLLDTLGADPVALAGHSAGAALALRLAVRRARHGVLRGVVGINTALSHPDASSQLMALASPFVRSLARRGMIGSVAAKLAGSGVVFRALMRSTGSTIPEDQVERYRTLARDVEHTNALMRMFAAWDLTELLHALPSLDVPVTLVIGTNDKWVPPVQSRRLALGLPAARVVEVEGAGHIAHEEFPERIAALIADVASGVSVTRHPRESTA